MGPLSLGYGNTVIHVSMRAGMCVYCSLMKGPWVVHLTFWGWGKADNQHCVTHSHVTSACHYGLRTLIFLVQTLAQQCNLQFS